MLQYILFPKRQSSYMHFSHCFSVHMNDLLIAGRVQFDLDDPVRN